MCCRAQSTTKWTRPDIVCRNSWKSLTMGDTDNVPTIFLCRHENFLPLVQILLSPYDHNFNCMQFKVQSMLDHLSSCRPTHCNFKLIREQSLQLRNHYFHHLLANLNACSCICKFCLNVNNSWHEVNDMSIGNTLLMTPHCGLTSICRRDNEIHISNGRESTEPFACITLIIMSEGSAFKHLLYLLSLRSSDVLIINLQPLPLMIICK